MKKTKILVVDDEVLSRQKIMRFIHEYPGNFRVFEADHGFKAMEIIREKRPEIVFLDIEMPEMNGMDLIECLTQTSGKPSTENSETEQFENDHRGTERVLEKMTNKKARHTGVLDFKLVFQTAYSEFAVEAFEKNALDYLLKPL